MLGLLTLAISLAFAAGLSFIWEKAVDSSRLGLAVALFFSLMSMYLIVRFGTPFLKWVGIQAAYFAVSTAKWFYRRGDDRGDI